MTRRRDRQAQLDEEAPMADKLRVGVIFGGRSGEHDVSVASATSVMNALDKDKYEVVPIGITPQGRWLAGIDPRCLLSGTSMQEAASTDRSVTAVEMTGDPTRRGLIPADGGSAQGVPTLDVVLPVLH